MKYHTHDCEEITRLEVGRKSLQTAESTEVLFLRQKILCYKMNNLNLACFLQKKEKYSKHE